MYNLIIWAGTENFVVLFCGCVPPLKSLWDRAMSKGGIIASLHLSRGRYTEDNSLIKRQNKSPSDESKKSSISLAEVSTARAGTYNSV